MSRHTIPASHRCLWCRRSFESVSARATHEHLVHRGNLARSQEGEAAARLYHLHQDRRVIELGRPVPETPAEVGRQLARRMAGLSHATFLHEADNVLEAMAAIMIDGGRPASEAFATCRAIRLAARVEWSRANGQECPANDR